MSTRFFYSKSTNFLLNHITLRLKDKEMREDYNKVQTSHLDNLFWRCLIFVLIYFVFRVLQAYNSRWVNLVPVMYAGQYIFNVLIWAVMRIKCKSLTPYLVFLFMAEHSLMVNLSYRDQVPEFMVNPDKTTEENKILLGVMICHALNYNSFLSTVVGFPLMTLPGVWFALRY